MVRRLQPADQSGEYRVNLGEQTKQQNNQRSGSTHTHEVCAHKQHEAAFQDPV